MPLVNKKKMPLKMEEKSLSESPKTTMEIEGEDGTKLFLKAGVKVVFGRGSGFNTDDLTVSRRHVSLELSESDRVSFEVLGRNPVWVRAGEKGAKIRTFRKFETGEIVAGDQFCVSGNLPIWFSLKRRDEVMEERDSDGESGLDSINSIDPVKEFGFLVIGKEFDQYPKSRMRDIKQWEWFLEDSTNQNSDADDDEDEGDKKGKKALGKKRRRSKKGNEDDDDWSVESEEDKDLLVKSKGVVNPTYSTRSKKTKKDTKESSSNAQTKQRGRVDVKEEEEDDATLGGFIVSDEEVNLGEEDEEEEHSDDDEDLDEED